MPTPLICGEDVFDLVRALLALNEAVTSDDVATFRRDWEQRRAGATDEVLLRVRLAFRSRGTEPPV